MGISGIFGLTGFDSEEQLKIAVWIKGAIILGSDPSIWRRDDLGYLIYWFAYGDRSSPYGWEMDHYPIPASLGGARVLDNLRPLYWGANAGLGGALGNLGPLSGFGGGW